MIEPITNTSSPLTIVHDRQTRMLRTAMGPAIAKALEDPDVVEVLLNPDGSMWLDRLGSGRAPSGVQLTAQDAERIIRERLTGFLDAKGKTSLKVA